MKNYVLDTNVLLYEPASLLGFKNHNIFISSIVLQELDNLKIKNMGVSQDARQVIRLLDKLIGDAGPNELTIEGVVRNELGGRLFIPTLNLHHAVYSDKFTNDQLIIKDALGLTRGELANDCVSEEIKNNDTIFVSKDINARLVAKAAGLKAQDYRAANLKRSDAADTRSIIPVDFGQIDTAQDHGESVFFDGGDKCRMTLDFIRGLTGVEPHPLLTMYTEDTDDRKGYMYIIRYINEGMAYLYFYPLHAVKNTAYGMSAIKTEVEQDIALRMLLDDTLPCVVLTGKAGSGKTILSLAAALELTAERKRYKKILITKSMSKLEEDIGFLPGTEADKMWPVLECFMDNLEVILFEGDTEAHPSKEMTINHILERYIQPKAINFMRGRSFQNTFIIVDEVQNLTPHQVKTLVTRVGQSSKIVLLGDLNQIDNPFLTEYSSGLAYVINRMRDSEYVGHVELKGSPRSDLAEDASTRL